MINFVKHNEIDFLKWDLCIENSINNLIYAYSWYLNIVCEEWDALVEDDYISVMPLPVKNKFGIKYILTPNFIQQLGVFSINIIDKEKTREFLKKIPLQIKYIELNINSYNNCSGNYKISLNSNCVLDLISSYDNIYLNYSDNLKRNLKKAEKSGVIVSPNTKPDEIIDIFKKNKGKEIRNWDENVYKNLIKLIYNGIHKGIVEVYGAYSPHNEICAGAIFFITSNRAIFLFSATDSKAKQMYAMPKIIDTFIKKKSSRNLILDFEGSNDLNLLRFYKSFGSNIVNYQTIIINRLNFFIKILFLIRKKVKRYL